MHYTIIDFTMRKYCFLIMLISSSVDAQESQLQKLSETKFNDSTVSLIYEIKIFNNTSHQICLRMSPSFETSILSTDTIELSSLKGDEIVHILV